jgi:sporulation protein YlmC with PRC-barrel domain
MSTFHLEDLVGIAVHDRDGRKVGHIYDMRGETRGEEIVVVEYMLGSGALLTRVGASLRAMVGIRQREPIRIRWNDLDLSDPTRPVYTGQTLTNQ